MRGHVVPARHSHREASAPSSAVVSPGGVVSPARATGSTPSTAWYRPVAALAAAALAAGGLTLVAPSGAQAAAAPVTGTISAASAASLADLVGSVGSIGTASTASTEAQFVVKINAARAAAGLRGYVVRSDLAAVAEGQAQRMAASNRLYHNPNLASEVRNYRWAGENVGYGPDVDALHNAFMASPSHRSNILDHDFTEVGLGAVWSEGRLWVAEVFREPTGASVATIQVEATKARASTQASRATTRPTLHYGQRSGWVKSVQYRLGVIRTGYFGPLTKAAVQRFQRSHRVKVTGVVNSATWRAMGFH